MRRVVGACVVVCLAALIGGAQPTPTLRVDTQIVLLDVSVTDAAGHPVSDLRQDEFHITEDKAPQAILSFETPVAHQMPAADAGKVVVNSTADLAKIGQAPITILILDELNMSIADRAYARTKTLEWLARQPAVLPQPTALMTVNDVDLKLLRDFTQDRDALLTVLRKHTGDVVWRSDSNGRTGELASQNLASTLGALERVSQAMRGVPGRKNIVWIGDGFPSVSMGDVGRTSADEIAANLRHLSNVMLHARVTLSIAGPTLKGHAPMIIETQGDQDSANTSEYTGVTLSNDHLEFGGLAAPTGGRAYGSRNDLDGEIAQSVDAGASYYTMSYRPTSHSNDAKQFRHIRVEVTRPGLVVQTREGYFPDLPQPEVQKIPPQQLAFDLYGAAASPLAYTDLHVTADRAGGADFVLHPAARDLTWRELPDGRRHADVVLLGACLTSNRKLLAKSFATLGSNSEASLAAIAVSATAVPMHLVVPPGTARIRFVVRDMTSGRVGTADVTP